MGAVVGRAAADGLRPGCLDKWSAGLEGLTTFGE
jgi:hypothetical protein